MIRIRGITTREGTPGLAGLNRLTGLKEPAGSAGTGPPGKREAAFTPSADAPGAADGEKQAAKLPERDERTDKARQRAVDAALFRVLLPRADELEEFVLQSGDPDAVATLKAVADRLERHARTEAEQRESAARRDRADNLEKRSGMIREARLLPLPELEQRFRAASDYAGTQDSPGDEQEERRLLGLIIAERQAALKEDPATAVLPLLHELCPAGVRTGAESEGATDPEFRTRMLLALQSSNGLAEGRSRVLTGRQAERLAGLWNARGTDRVLLARVVARLGRFAGRAVQETPLNKSQKLSFMELLGSI